MTTNFTCSCLDRLLSLLDHLCETRRIPKSDQCEVICHLVCSFSVDSLSLLEALKDERPEFVTPVFVESCLLAFRGKGQALIMAARKFGLSDQLRQVNFAFII